MIGKLTSIRTIGPPKWDLKSDTTSWHASVDGGNFTRFHHLTKSYRQLMAAERRETQFNPKSSDLTHTNINNTKATQQVIYYKEEVISLRGEDMGRVMGRGKWCKYTNHILFSKINEYISSKIWVFKLKWTLMLIKETWINPQTYIKEYLYNQQSKMIDQVEVTLSVTSSCQGQSIIINMLRETVSHKWHYAEPILKEKDTKIKLGW